jgi:phage terminase large subunit
MIPSPPARSDPKVWRPIPGPQERALSIRIRELLFGGRRGGAKTEAGIVWIMRPALEFPDYQGLVLRKNYVDLRDWMRRAKRHFKCYGARPSGDAFVFPNGSIVQCGHLKDADAYAKYQGHEYQRMLIEEATQIEREEDYQMLIASCRSSIHGLYASIFLTCNPGGPGHWWIKKRFVDPAPWGTAFEVRGGFRVFIPSGVANNPYLPKSYLQQLQDLPEHIRRAWVDGDWDALAGQYFHEWRRATHVVKPFNPPKHWPRYCGLDWGYYPDPWACVWAAFDEQGRAHVYRVATGNRMTPEEVEDEIIRLSGDEDIRDVVADPSMWARRDSAESSASKFRNLALVKGDNARLHGWMRLHEFLRVVDGVPNLTVAETCLDLINAIPALQHRTKGDPEDCDDSPVDHLPDGLRYLLMSRPLPAVAIKENPLAKDPRARMAHEHRKKILVKPRRDRDL